MRIDSPPMRAHAIARTRASAATCVLLSLLACSRAVFGVEIDLVHRGDGAIDDMKCISEEIHANAVVLFTYDTVRAEDKVSVKLFDANGKVIYEKADAGKGAYGFTSVTDGDHRACFYNAELSSMKNSAEKETALAKHRIKVDWKHGVAASEWKKLAKATDLDAFTRTLRSLESDLQEVHEGMLALRALEADMRDMNEATNTRVAVMSVLSLTVCVGMCVWQIVYLRSFFERKKLL